MVDQFGMNIVDVRVKRIDLPDEVSSAVFTRMRSERDILARQYRATGEELALGITADADRQAIVIEAEAYKESQQIRGDGDARATKIYAEAYGQDENFYAFYRRMVAYPTVFAPDGGSLMVIDPSNDFFELLTNKMP